MTAQPLALTGERTVPEVPAENYWFRRHEAAYRYVRAEVTGPVVLEVGAGEGYGAAQLSRSGQQTVALDYDRAAIGHLHRRYPQLLAVQGNLAALPVRTASTDTLVCLQVIEHVWDHPQFVSECARVLRPGGSLILSTPNRLTFSPDRARPRNPFHTHEFVAHELRGLIEHAGLQVLQLAGLVARERLRELDARWGGSLADAQLAVDPGHWDADLRSDVASVATDDFEFHDPAADDCLDLLLIARRR
ncbi:methyltransferase domain-containing protein [Jatrophihabitans telluris]|uniref:Methyltransferase domain-containing protein n=1 Tax=Jatrophihabitans telluris TaxID=2038343 RepID=A0ABY4R519_9ACTN|nr:SAM-dependent methyltransferase [Jatrophihabitans telluris]UQX89919.1 methyltransferase domain-containing protein [Jatrophihabitans telluris]